MYTNIDCYLVILVYSNSLGCHYDLGLQFWKEQFNQSNQCTMFALGTSSMDGIRIDFFVIVSSDMSSVFIVSLPHITSLTYALFYM